MGGGGLGLQPTQAAFLNSALWLCFSLARFVTAPLSRYLFRTR
jgi:hypothetical protein